MKQPFYKYPALWIAVLLAVVAAGLSIAIWTIGWSHAEMAFECESMQILDRSPGVVARVQDTRMFGTGWSGDAQLFVKPQGVGDYLEIAIPAPDPAARKVILHATEAPDYGVLKFTVNGKPAGAIFDGYAANPAPTGPIDLGIHAPKAGIFVLRIEVVGANPASTGGKYFFGLDAVILERP